MPELHCTYGIHAAGRYSVELTPLVSTLECAGKLENSNKEGEFAVSRLQCGQSEVIDQLLQDN